MLPTLQQLLPAATRFDRTQVVLEMLSRDNAVAVKAALPGLTGSEQAVTITQRLTAGQGGGYLVAFQGRSMALPLRGDYVAGQVVRLALAAAPDITSTVQEAAEGPVTLGVPARLIGAILARGAELPAGAPVQFATSAAARAEPPPAEALKQALSESGVFYESHVAEWAQGERTLDALRREPQGRTELTPDNAATGNAADASDVPDALVPVVREQLQAIDTRQLAWRGELWPRQTIELTIAEEQAGHQEEDAPAAWSTTMKLDLPRLGGIQAVLQMQGDCLRIGVRASDESTPTLKDRSGELAASLAAFGLKLISMRVDEHGAPTV